MGALMAEDYTVVEVSTGELILERDGKRTRAFVAADGDDRWVFVDGRTWRLESGPPAARPRSAAHGHGGALAAPMPATVLRILAKPGAVVRKGDTLVVLEAMKMELPLRAPQDGTVGAVHCAEGQLVQPGVTLVEIS
jgi:3-methylcrotonyl-CoA carboxylase alpha subunit